MTNGVEIQHRFVDVNGIRLHVAEAGEGPAVILLHGFPESWYSWRHQLRALAQAGYRAIAPDQRGYGQTSRPEPIEQYTMLHLVGDVVGLIENLRAGPVVVVGHDWGAPVAWSTALFRPDLVRGVAGLSVPYRPRGGRPPVATFRAVFGESFYQIYFQRPGVAEADLERDVRESIRRALYGASGDYPVVPNMLIREGLGFFGEIDVPEPLPAWLAPADIDYYTAEFERTGFAGALNWYRNIDRNWELTAPWQDAKVTVSALYMVGDRDIVYHFPRGKEAAAGLSHVVPNLTKTIVLEGCGHWTQQERPAEVNWELAEFIQGLD